MPGRKQGSDVPESGVSSGLSDLRALIRPKPKPSSIPQKSDHQPVPATELGTKSGTDSAEQNKLEHLIALLSELEPQLQKYEQSDSDNKQLGQLSMLSRMVNRLADRVVEELPNCREALFEDAVRKATQYWLNSGELLDPNSPLNTKGFLGLRKAIPPEWAARLHQQLGLAPRVVQSLLLALGLPLRIPETKANWHGAVMAFVSDFQTTLHWTKSD